jgi:predicted solute-binding protein
MDIKRINQGIIGRMNPRIATWLFSRIKKLPSIEKKIEQEYAALLHGLEPSVKPYREQFDTYSDLPDKGRSKSEILTEMQALTGIESSRWQEGYASGAVYHGDADHINFLNQVYAFNSQSNPLNTNLKLSP